MIRLKCPKCEWEWNHKHKYDERKSVTCPYCQSKTNMKIQKELYEKNSH